jgi:hypothetical protein
MLITNLGAGQGGEGRSDGYDFIDGIQLATGKADPNAKCVWIGQIVD